MTETTEYLIEMTRIFENGFEPCFPTLILHQDFDTALEEASKIKQYSPNLKAIKMFKITTINMISNSEEIAINV